MIIKEISNKEKLKICLVTVCKFYRECDILTYIDHYLNYLNFNHIYLFTYNTKFNIKKYESDNVTVINANEFNFTRSPQQYIYNNFIQSPEFLKYDYTAFFDDDELLWVSEKFNHNIIDFLSETKSDYYIIPWREIGNNEIIEDRNEPYKNIFFYVYSEIEPVLSKIIIKNNTKNIINMDVHYCICNDNINIFKEKNISIKDGENNLSNRILTLTVTDNYANSNIILYHYYRRSKQEWDEKLKSEFICMSDKRLGENTYLKDLPFTTYNKYLNPFNVI